MKSFKASKPSDWKDFFWSSVFQRSEDEETWRIIMNVLINSGDQWREVTFKEYKEAGGIRYADDFAKIAAYTTSAETANLFTMGKNRNKFS